MNVSFLDALRDIIQEDVGNRGLRTDPSRNLVNACPQDFATACRSLASHPHPVLGVVTGFFIPTATPPCGETDGPLGALFLARALVPIGVPIVLATDAFCAPALHAGLAACALQDRVQVIVLPAPDQARGMTPDEYRRSLSAPVRNDPLTHLLAIERVGPSHTVESMKRQAGGTPGEPFLDFLHEVPDEHQDRCHTMRGRDITDVMSPAHLLFESAPPGLVTLGIGDGGNELGMGKIPWEVIHRNIPNGGRVACRVATAHLIVCGVSNWGAYALAAGVAALRGRRLDPHLFDPDVEQKVLQVMVRHGPLVDGVLGRPSATVDGLTWGQYSAVLTRLAHVLNSGVTPPCPR
jgi:D-glutamate cyclase